MDSTEPDWSTLPTELLNKIANGLPTPSDILRFGAVCKRFLYSVLVSPKPPAPYKAFKIPFPSNGEDDTSYIINGHLVLTESAFYSIEPLPSRTPNKNVSNKTLIVKLEKSSLTGKMRVKEPLSRFRFRQMARSLPRSLNLMEYQVNEIKKVYGLDFVAVRKRKAGDIEYHQLETALSFHKVVVSTCRDGFQKDFAIMATHGFAELSLWRPGQSEWISITLVSHGKFSCEDVVYHKNKFYAVELSGLTISIDHRSSFISCAAAALPKSILGLGFKYLVSSLDDLFLVVKTHVHYHDESDGHDQDEDDESPKNYGIYMCVYKLVEKRRKWVRVRGTLNDRVFFVGDDCSFSVCAKEFPGLRNNSVYFNDDGFAEASEDHPGWYPGIYDLKYDLVGPLSAFPQYSRIFWPVPHWLRNPGALAGS